MKEITFKQIGTIHTNFKTKINVPIQPTFSESKGRVEVFQDYKNGLKDLEGFSHVVLVYLFHKSSGYDLLQKPFLDEEKRGLFSTRSPRRPNPIGLSTVELEKIEDNILHVKGLDIIDSTPLLDIKPYIKDFEDLGKIRLGWIKGKIKDNHKSDERFGE